MSSTFLEVMPISSASTMPINTHFDQIEPLVIAMAHERTERLLGDALGQDGVLALAGELTRTNRGETGGVGRVGIAATSRVGLQELVELLDQHRFEGHLVLAEVVGE